MPRSATILFLTLYAGCGAAGDLLLSHGIKHLAIRFVIGGVACCAAAFAIFLGLLQKLPCSIVVPAQASNYIVTVTACWLLLHESVQALRWVGTVLVSIGVAMVVQSAHHHAEEPERPPTSQDA
jgi:drug/metabolite transporter (DMT)-like permease